MTPSPTRVIGGLLALLLGAGALPARAEEAPAARYLDPPKAGLSHADRWVVEAAPAFVYLMRSVLESEALADPGFALDLRVARGLAFSGDEIGGRLRPVFFRGSTGFMATGGYRLHFGREQWKTHLEFEVVLHWVGGPGVGLRAAGGVIRELGPRAGLLFDAGVGGAVGQALVGWIETRVALQLRF